MKRPQPPRSEPRHTRTIRLSQAEERLLEAAAASKPTYLTTYIRRAALDAARRDLAASGGGTDEH